MITHDFVCFCPIQKLLLLDDLHKPDAVQEGFTNRLCAYKSLCRSYFMLSLVQVQNSTVLSFSPLMQIFCSHFFRFSVLIFTDTNGDIPMKTGSELVHEDESIQPSGVSVDGLTASWGMDHDKLVLSDISFTINKVGSY